MYTMLRSIPNILYRRAEAGGFRTVLGVPFMRKGDSNWDHHVDA